MHTTHAIALIGFTAMIGRGMASRQNRTSVGYTTEIALLLTFIFGVMAGRDQASIAILAGFTSSTALARKSLDTVTTDVAGLGQVIVAVSNAVVKSVIAI